jgi:hypothetical protein
MTRNEHRFDRLTLKRARADPGVSGAAASEGKKTDEGTKMSTPSLLSNLVALTDPRQAETLMPEPTERCPDIVANCKGEC